MKLQRLCKCGCGGLVRKTHHRFRFGHYRHTEEHKIKMSRLMMGREVSEETKRKLSTIRTGTKHTEETKRKITKSILGVKNPFWGKIHTNETKQKLSSLRKNIKASKETKRKMSKSQIRLWSNPDHHKEQRRKMSHGNNMRPNKKETKLLNLLESIQPNEWKYVGDGELIIVGKNPDFVNVNGKKLLIELFGDYWHKNDRPQKRRRVFKPYGYKTLVIWERELKNIPKVTERINKFVRC